MNKNKWKGFGSTDADDLQIKMHQLKVSYLMQCWDLHTAFGGIPVNEEAGNYTRNMAEAFVNEYPNTTFMDFKKCLCFLLMKDGSINEKEYKDMWG